MKIADQLPNYVWTLAQDAAATPPAPGSELARKTLWEYILAGGPIGYILIVMSIVAVAIWIMLFLELQLNRLAPPDVRDQLSRLFREGNTAEALRYCQHTDNNSFLARLFSGALLRCSRSQFGFLEIRTALEESGARQIERLYRTCDWVALVAALGPMLGLLGTVFGMIGAFGSISKLQGAARSEELAGFMSLALVNTAMGLAVAIPCTMMYAIFRRKIDALTERVAEIAEAMVVDLESRPAQPERGPAKPIAPRPQAARPAAPQAGAPNAPIPLVPEARAQ